MRKVLLIALFIATSTAQADMFGAADAQIIVQIKTMIDEMRKVTKLAKQGNEYMQMLRDFQENKEGAVMDLLELGELHEAVIDARTAGEAIFDSDGFDPDELDYQLGKLRRAMDKATSERERSQIRYELVKLEKMAELERLDRAAEKSALRSSRHITESEANRISARNISITAAAMVALNKRALREEAAIANDRRGTESATHGLAGAFSTAFGDNDE